MADLQWFEVNPPRDLDLTAVTAVVRPLADRPRTGLGGGVPLVVFELWSVGGTIRYLLGVDHRLRKNVPIELTAQLPRLGLVPIKRVIRPVLGLAADVRLHGTSAPLRLDMASSVSAGLLAALRELDGSREAAVVQWVLGPAHSRRARPSPFSVATSLGLRAPDKPDAASARAWRDKTSEPLFAVRGRIGAVGKTPARAYRIIRSLSGALRLADSQHAAVRVGKASPGRARKLHEAASALAWSLMNAAEIASILGWPLGEVPSDGLPVVGGHVNPVPASLRLPENVAADRPGERVLGESLHPAERGELVTVPVKTSLHHMHVIGPTGSGKSTLLTGLITADIAAGRSVLVIEPKGDLVNDVLARVPEHRRDDVVLWEPNAARSVGFNVLSGPRDQAERRADQIVSLLAELHGASFGPRTTDIAIHAAMTASRLPDGTLCDIPFLLTNPAFRRSALTHVSDPLVLGPWWAGFDALSDAERGQHVAPLLNKLRPFTSREALRRMLGQAAPKFDLAELFTKRRVVLINLNKGLLGAGTSSLLGALILNYLWASVQRRSAVPADKRHMVAAYIDEVQDYLHLPGVDLGDFFAQARGLGVSMTVAHQHLDQLSASQRAGILANARSRVAFRPAPSDAKPLAAAMGGGLTGDDLLRLRAFEACAQLHLDGQPTQPFSVRTRPLPPWTSNPDDLRRTSAERYGVDGAELDKALTERWQGGNAPPDGPVGVKRRRSS
jgi:Type IV secretory system Conjugative DNA transfer